MNISNKIPLLPLKLKPKQRFVREEKKKVLFSEYRFSSPFEASCYPLPPALKPCMHACMYAANSETCGVGEKTVTDDD